MSSTRQLQLIRRTHLLVPLLFGLTPAHVPVIYWRNTTTANEDDQSNHDDRRVVIMVPTWARRSGDGVSNVRVTQKKHFHLGKGVKELG
jgi:hypothetical protein